MSLWPANSRTSCMVAPLRMASLIAVLRKLWMPMPRAPSRDGSIPAARQYFFTSRQGVLRSRCRRISRDASQRHYTRAKELKGANMDWTQVLEEEAENRRVRLAAELLASPTYASTAARVRAFVEQGGGCRATFFNYRRYLLK